MHKQNEEAWLNPETWQKRAPGIVPVLREDLPSINTVSGRQSLHQLPLSRQHIRQCEGTKRPNMGVVSFMGAGFDRVQTPMYARGSVFANQPTPQQLMEKDKYKSFLKQQVLSCFGDIKPTVITGTESFYTCPFFCQLELKNLASGACTVS